MLGKLAKYSFLMFILGCLVQFIVGPELNMKIMLFICICLFISMMSFFGWYFGGPITVVVKEDHSSR